MREAPQTSRKNHRRSLEIDSWFAVVRAYFECNRKYADLMHHFDLTISQYDVLVAIVSLEEEAYPKAIAQRLLVTRANVSGLIKRLVERGLVSTQAHAVDARSFLCKLTPAGAKLSSEARAAAARFIRAQLAPFADDELENVESWMREMHAHLDTLDTDSIAFPIHSTD